ncbi:MAG: hypothetical protein FJ291_30350 [Planctomycetes bacterium]|nr:hypothetical protein [Planctomycetota bacterium]
MSHVRSVPVWLWLALGAGAVAAGAGSPKGAAGPKGAVGEQKVLVVMARFPDVPPAFSIEAMQGKYFTRLDRYVRAISGGKTWVTGKMTQWYVLPRPVAEYRISQHNLSVDKGRVRQLIRDAVDLADEDEGLSRYSMVFLSLGAKRTGYGMMGLCGYTGMLGWQDDAPLKTSHRGQAIPGGVAIFCEEAHVGVVFHDMAHILGGVAGGKRVVPCLYDHDLQGKRGEFRGYAQFYLTHVGYFDPMSCHFVKPTEPPPGPCAWTKLRLGWVEPRAVVEVPKGASKTVSLAPLNGAKAGVQAVKVPLDATTYYLIENRQPPGPDASLPAHGILISYCDDSVGECRHGQSPVKLIDANPSTPELKGAPFAPGGRDSFTDAKRGVTARIRARARTPNGHPRAMDTRQRRLLAPFRPVHVAREADGQEAEGNQRDAEVGDRALGRQLAALRLGRAKGQHHHPAANAEQAGGVGDDQGEMWLQPPRPGRLPPLPARHPVASWLGGPGGRMRGCEKMTRTRTDRHGHTPVAEESARPCLSVGVRVISSQAHEFTGLRPAVKYDNTAPLDALRPRR